MAQLSKHKRALVLSILLLVLAALFLNFGLVHAQEDDTDPKRLKYINVDSLQYTWQLVFRSDNSAACEFSVDHANEPTDEEIQSACGVTLLDDWKNTTACETTDENCSGITLQNTSSTPIHKQILVKLPTPEVRISLSGCYYYQSSNYCTGEPVLILTGSEPLPNEEIIDIQGTLGDEDFYCDGNHCAVSLSRTDPQGVVLSFWGDSSYGDSTEIYDALVRVLPVSGTDNGYKIDVVSDQWTGKNPPSCAAIWNVLPDSEGIPNWLTTPLNSQELASNKSLYYLAAALIRNKVVDASACEHNGLANNVTANECGLSAAGPKIEYWQNRFDQEILAVSHEDDIPAHLLKNVFLKESQFWPGQYSSLNEVGLGQFTENGADTVLLWNQGFYNAFCPLVLDEYNCNKGFARLGSYGQAVLKGALLQKINASCPSCEDGIDLTKANFSIHVFAESLEANCSQVYQIIFNSTQNEPYLVSSYSDLWRFTLLNYNAGAGCLTRAINRTWNANDPIDWAHVTANLEQGCRKAVDYVFDVTGGDADNRIVFSTEFPTPTPKPFYTSIPTLTRTPSLTPTITLTLRATKSPTPTFVVVPSDTPTPTSLHTPTPSATPSSTTTPSPTF
ncbi:MAG: hypothetical protein VB013_06750 [Anaerolineaceae bacterium]|nr:hypothetical protein [Anaerolineaceae bacterium]